MSERIMEEEAPNMPYINYRPRGPNIFLSLQVPGHTKKDIGFLALERENEDLWIATYWTSSEKKLIRAIEDETLEKPPLLKRKVHPIEDHRPEKILTQYAKFVKFYHGE
jgi:hypothetical protein